MFDFDLPESAIILDDKAYKVALFVLALSFTFLFKAA